ncbi:MAG: hypothetical protein AAGI38_12785 [Bacteroidota bacterium]
MTLIKLLLNFGLLVALLVSPCLLLMAHWYRKQMPNTVMSWKKPELVLVTIIYSVVALILFIVGISCFFIHLGYLESTQIEATAKDRFFSIGLFCFLIIVSLIFTYAALRMLLVQVVTDKGLVCNDRMLRIPDYRNVVEWHEILDYYIKSDYPNVIFSLIIQKKVLKYDRMAIKVPVYIRDDFEHLLETKMYSAKAIKARTEMSRSRYSEN